MNYNAKKELFKKEELDFLFKEDRRISKQFLIMFTKFDSIKDLKAYLNNEEKLDLYSFINTKLQIETIDEFKEEFFEFKKRIKYAEIINNLMKLPETYIEKNSNYCYSSTLVKKMLNNIPKYKKDKINNFLEEEIKLNIEDLKENIKYNKLNQKTLKALNNAII